jgi:predicted cupin superfamily sugar epimerase
MRNSIVKVDCQNLLPHPEGGHYKEVFRSSQKVRLEHERERDALTHIYYQLDCGERSRLHLVTSDEVWNLYRGTLKLYLWDEEKVTEMVLSSESNTFCCVVPAGVWQAAEPMGESALVGCSVGPGFDFQDFSMLRDTPDLARLFLEQAPEYSAFV